MEQVVVHNTDIGSFKKCRTLWDFTSPLRRNLQPITPVPPLEFGTIWHSALSTYYTNDLKGQELIADVHGVIDEGFDKWEESAGDLGPEEEEELKGHRELCHGMFTNYVLYAIPRDNFEVVWTENAYEVPLFDDVAYGFKPDALLKIDGRYWMGEWKSAKTLPSNTDYLLNDDQVGRYLWGLREAEGIEVEGCAYRISRKAVPRPPKLNANGFFSIDRRQLTTYDLAVQAINDHHGKMLNRYAEYLAYLKERDYDDYFVTVPVRRNPNELTNIGKSLKAEVKEMLSDPYIHRTPSAFNCNYCSFQGPCISKWEGSDYEAVLEGNYKERERVG